MREECPGAGIVLHLDFGTNNELYRQWFDRIAPFALDYDVIGMSYYPHWNGSLEQLQNNMNDISARYGKNVLVVELSLIHIYPRNIRAKISIWLAFSLITASRSLPII